MKKKYCFNKKNNFYYYDYHFNSFGPENYIQEGEINCVKDAMSGNTTVFFSVNDTIKYSHKLTCAVKYSRWQLNCQTIFATIWPPIISFSYFYFSNCFLNWGNPRHLKSPRRQPYIHTSILFSSILIFFFVIDSFSRNGRAVI